MLATLQLFRQGNENFKQCLMCSPSINRCHANTLQYWQWTLLYGHSLSTQKGKCHCSNRPQPLEHFASANEQPVAAASKLMFLS